MSTTKKLALILAVFVLCALGATLISAQDNAQQGQRPPDGRSTGSRALVAALAELADTTPQDMLKDLEPGTTLNDIIMTYNLDPAVVITQAENTITAAVDERVANGRLSEERAAKILQDLNTQLTDLLAEPIPGRQPPDRRDNIQDNAERALVGALVELTGLQPQDLLEQARTHEYGTLAELAEANNIVPADLITAASANAAARLEEAVANDNMTAEQATDLQQRLDEFFNNAIEADLDRLFAPPRRSGNDPLKGLLLQEVATAAGLEPADIIEQLREGSTAAEILAANGADPDAVIASVIAQMNTQMEEQLQEMLNNPLPAPPPAN